MNAEADLHRQLQPHMERGLQLWLEDDALRFKAPRELMTQDLVQLLKQNKEGIRRWLQGGEAGAEAGAEVSAETDTATSRQPADSYPLASTQAAIWMLYRLAPHSPAYNTTFAATLNQEPDESAIRQALTALMLKHPMLRTTFVDEDNGPMQQVWPRLPLPFSSVDASDWSQDQLQEQLNREADASFDLQHQPCFRVKLFRNSVQGHVLVATVHHIGADLWALLLIADDIKNFYDKAVHQEPLHTTPAAMGYARHVRWQDEYLNSDSGNEAREFWQRQLRGAPATVTLPVDRPRPPMLALDTDVLTTQINAEIYQQVKNRCRGLRVTPFVLMNSLFQLLVHYFTDASDFLMGTPTLGRNQNGMDKVVGDFANPVVLRCRPQPQVTFGEFLEQAKQTLLLAMEYQDYPFPAVVQDANPPRDTSRTPLFQLMFLWHQGNPEAFLKQGLIRDILPMSGPRGAPYDVMLAVSDPGDGFELKWTYQKALYQQETVEQFNRFYLALLDWFIAQPEPDLKNRLVEDALVALPQKSQSSEKPNKSAESLRQDDGLKQQVVEQLPELQTFDSVALLQCPPNNTDSPVRRFFIAADQQQLQAQSTDLQQWFDNVVVLPRIPRSADGKVNLQFLAGIPCVNQSLLQQQWQAHGISTQDWVLQHELYALPGFPESLGVQNKARSQAAGLQQGNKPQDPALQVTKSQTPALVTSTPLSTTTHTPSNLVQALQQTAEQFPDRGIRFIGADTAAESDTKFTYAQLWQQAQAVARNLQQQPLPDNAIVLLQVAIKPSFFALWWGVVLAGKRPLVVALPEQFASTNGVAGKLYNVAHRFDELVVIADDNRVKDTRHWLGNKTVLPLSRVTDDAANEPFTESHYLPEFPAAGDTAFLQLTSGSTGTPKAIQITHGGILHHVAASAAHNGYQPSDISLNWLPFDHVVPILTFHLKDVVLGIEQLQLPTAAVLADPLLWIESLSRHKVTHGWAPNFAYQKVVDALGSDTRVKNWDLSSLRWLMNAGEQVLPATIKQFSRSLQPFGLGENVVQPAFGMAEVCTCMTYNNDSSTRPVLHHGRESFADLGPVVPGVDVRITDEHNRLLNEGEIGRLQIRGPVVTPGYLHNPEANAEAFVGDGWFNTGDLGFLWQGRLVLTGREKEMIIVNGANFYCYDIEHQVATVAGVRPTFVAATAAPVEGGSEALLIFYVPESESTSAIEKDVATRIAQSFGIYPAAVIPVLAEDFYKTTSGKIQRSQFRKQWQSGFYQQAAEAYRLRHGKNREPVAHGFRWAWQIREHHPVNTETPHSRFVLDENTDNQSLNDYLGNTESANKLIQLQTLPVLTKANNQQWFEWVQQFSRLSQCLLHVQNQSPDAFADQVITLLIAAEHQHQLALVKPLVETLRLETGMPAIGCVLMSSEQASNYQHFTACKDMAWYGNGALTSLALENVQVQSPRQIKAALKQNGVYLVTGGLGALAEKLCHWLVKTCNARLIITGRRELSTDHQALSRFSRLMSGLEQDTANRSTTEKPVHYLHLPDWHNNGLKKQDLHDQIQQTLALMEADTLDGVFHLAGALEMQTLDELEACHWQQVSQAKLDGSQLLADYLESHWPGSLLVQFGSVNSFFGGQQAAAYSFANAFQGYLTESCNERGIIRAWCLHWSYWEHTGMANSLSRAQWQMAQNKGFLPLHPEQDLVQLDRLLGLPAGNYLSGLDPQQPDIQAAMGPVSGFEVRTCITLDGSAALPNNDASSKELANSLRQQAQSCWQVLSPVVGAPTIQLHISEEPLPRNHQGFLLLNQLQATIHQQATLNPPQTDSEEQLAELWQSVLQQPVTDVTRTFFEYGGHSINAVQLVAAINKKLQMACSVADLFQYPTVRELAAYLDQGADQQPDQTAARLSLAIPDCLQRADSYRIDCLTAETTDIHCKPLVFLPTAIGMPGVYWQLIQQLPYPDIRVASMPLKTNEQTNEQTNADTRLAAQASAFANLIRADKSFNDGCILVGWSYAGVLGYEILQQGIKADLVMLDSGFADGLHEITFDSHFQQLMFAVELGLTQDCFADFNQLDSQEEKMVWFSGYLNQLGMNFNASELAAYYQSYQARLNNLLQYQVPVSAPLTSAPSTSDPLTTSNSSLHLLKAEWHQHGRSDLGWPETVNIHWQGIAADHQSIVKAPQTAAWLKNFLQTGQQQSKGKTT